MTARLHAAILAAVVASAFVVSSAVADDGSSRIKARLSGYQESPTLSSPAVGAFQGKISSDETEISYVLSYEGLPTSVRFAHLHLGARAVNGGVIIFLCANTGTFPAGTPACPQGSGTVEGTLTAAGVIGPAGQGIAPGEFAELVDALRAGAVYANVHTDQYPGGEIRGQVKADGN